MLPPNPPPRPPHGAMNTHQSGTYTVNSRTPSRQGDQGRPRAVGASAPFPVSRRELLGSREPQRPDRNQDALGIQTSRGPVETGTAATDVPLLWQAPPAPSWLQPSNRDQEFPGLLGSGGQDETQRAVTHVASPRQEPRAQSQPQRSDRNQASSGLQRRHGRREIDWVAPPRLLPVADESSSRHSWVPTVPPPSYEQVCAADRRVPAARGTSAGGAPVPVGPPPAYAPTLPPRGSARPVPSAPPEVERPEPSAPPDNS